MPLGQYPDWDSCIEAQQNKGKDVEAARRICGALEQQSEAAAKTAQYNKISAFKLTKPHGHLLVRAFLIDPSLNINNWGVTEESIEQNINTFIGKPLVLTENYDHPILEDEMEMDTMDHWLAYQETYRVGNIIDIVPKKNPTTGSTAYHAIIEVTNKDVKQKILDNKIPFYVSPAIGSRGNSSIIDNWEGAHLAIVSEPAYGIKKAVISETCGGDKQACLLQLRKANIEKFGVGNCGFCTKKAMDKYEIIQKLRTSHGLKSSANNKKMSQLEPTGESTADPNSTHQKQEVIVEKVEQPHQAPISKQPIHYEPPTTTTFQDLLTLNQKLTQENELLKISNEELRNVNGTLGERIGALELRDRRKEIERIVTADVIKNDKERLEKIKYLTNSAIPIDQIEALYADLKITIKKASINSRSLGGKVPYLTSSNMGSGSVMSSGRLEQATQVDEDGMTPLQKQLAVLEGGI